MTTKDLKVTGSTFTSPDPESQRISSTEHARPARNLGEEVRAQRTFQKGVVPDVDLALTTRNSGK